MLAKKGHSKLIIDHVLRSVSTYISYLTMHHQAPNCFCSSQLFVFLLDLTQASQFQMQKLCGCLRFNMNTFGWIWKSPKNSVNGKVGCRWLFLWHVTIHSASANLIIQLQLEDAKSYFCVIKRKIPRVNKWRAGISDAQWRVESNFPNTSG